MTKRGGAGFGDWRVTRSGQEAAPPHLGHHNSWVVFTEPRFLLSQILVKD